MTDEPELPFLARLINHVLTPGSALSPAVWIAFNVVMAALLLCWVSLIIAMPDNIHVWVFGFLGAGLAFSTNWLFKEIFRCGPDDQKPQREVQQKQTEPHEKKND
ncbi:hypothetical protein DQ04_00921060 [Trypanosoma grayi]|uniref:hypothetical protein n=1 Tax=Trypanosoma grayi TaxID=71804 RepID=UPI0004F42869|nr:hypothetical protein DQ04_00921060 [Trypanosoma grayi]KEG13572.1 hypothetical protein DQ04_00921060 [Trypanosoma grayi]